ncbi:hypothetical protein BDF19DRAFT_433937 [Syncephalis fuscata]|nr:hypothetical protein BDF19DRAFT_433937 [Syncephalis fuscata]
MKVAQFRPTFYGNTDDCPVMVVHFIPFVVISITDTDIYSPALSLAFSHLYKVTFILFIVRAVLCCYHSAFFMRLVCL